MNKMDWKILSLDSKMLLVILILLLMSSFPGLMPLISEPIKCMTGGCDLLIGMPYPYLIVSWDSEGGIVPDLNILGLVVDIVTFYLASVILFYLLRGGKKNVSDSNDRG